MAMSRRDYVKLADTLGRAVAVESTEGGGEGIRAAGAAYRVALAVADTLHDSGASFDGGRFLDAVAVAASRARSALAAKGGASYGAGAALDAALSQRRAGSRF